MDEVTLDPQQVPARAELLLAAGFGQEARGRPIHSRLESNGNGDGDGEPAPRVEIGAVRTRRLARAKARPGSRSARTATRSAARGKLPRPFPSARP